MKGVLNGGMGMGGWALKGTLRAERPKQKGTISSMILFTAKFGGQACILDNIPQLGGMALRPSVAYQIRNLYIYNYSMYKRP